MTAIQILLLRHAEKPRPSGRPAGLTPEGNEDPKSLTIRGWQRAGALAALFGSGRSPAMGLPLPDRIYASAFRDGGGHSRRPEQTVLPLAQKLELPVDLSWALNQEPAFGAALASRPGTSLVCWQHQGLAALARAITVPQRLPEFGSDWSWPDDRYDVIWSLRSEGAGETWRFTQHCPMLLAGDSDRAFSLGSETPDK